MVRSLLGFPGDLHLVNPTGRPRSRDAPVARSVRAIGAAVDLAVLVVPAEAVPSALEDCGAGGVKAAVVCAGGFAETAGGRSPPGRGRGDRSLGTACALLGPNTSGFMNPVDGVMANFVPYVTRLEPGPASIVASSGGMNLAVSFLASGEGLGLRLGVGLGNTVDVGFAEILDFLADDDATRVIGLHIEGVDDGRGLYEAVGRVSKREACRGVEGRAIRRGRVRAVAHRASARRLRGVTCAALAQAGAVVVDDVGQLVDAMRALVVCRMPPSLVAGHRRRDGASRTGPVHHRCAAQPRRLGSDALRIDGEGPRSVCLPPLTLLTNPVDTGRPSETFGQVLALVAADDAIDAMVVYALKESDVINPEVAFRTPGVARRACPSCSARAAPARCSTWSARARRDRRPAVPRRPSRRPAPCARSSRTRWQELGEIDDGAAVTPTAPPLPDELAR